MKVRGDRTQNTRSWESGSRLEWGRERFPPTVKPAPEDEQRVLERWKKYGLDRI